MVAAPSGLVNERAAARLGAGTVPRIIVRGNELRKVATGFVSDGDRVCNTRTFGEQAQEAFEEGGGSGKRSLATVRPDAVSVKGGIVGTLPVVLADWVVCAVHQALPCPVTVDLTV
jgi:hypothetical protein